MSGTQIFLWCVVMSSIGIIFPIKAKKSNMFSYGVSMLILALVFWAIISEPLKTQFPTIYSIVFWINVVAVLGGVYLLTSLIRQFKKQKTN